MERRENYEKNIAYILHHITFIRLLLHTKAAIGCC